MEIVNFLVIVICLTICLIWALKKRLEIQSMKIAFTEEKDYLDEDEEKSLKREKKIMSDSEVKYFKLLILCRNYTIFQIFFKKLHWVF